MDLKGLILARYEIRQKKLDFKNKTAEAQKAEDLLDDLITFRALLLEDPIKAKRFKRLHLDNKREGLFNTKIKNIAKLEIPELIIK